MNLGDLSLGAAWCLIFGSAIAAAFVHDYGKKLARWIAGKVCKDTEE